MDKKVEFHESEAVSFCAKSESESESEEVAFCAHGKRLKGKVLYLVMKIMEVWLGFSGEICRGKPGQSTSGFSRLLA